MQASTLHLKNEKIVSKKRTEVRIKEKCHSNTVIKLNQIKKLHLDCLEICFEVSQLLCVLRCKI